MIFYADETQDRKKKDIYIEKRVNYIFIKRKSLYYDRCLYNNHRHMKDEDI